jgi:hypothetical protein
MLRWRITAGSLAVVGFVASGCAVSGHGTEPRTSAQAAISRMNRTITTRRCAIAFRGYALSWRANLTVRNGEVVSYRIRYGWKRRVPSARALSDRAHNNEELVYWNDSWRSPDRERYGVALERAPDSWRAVDGRGDSADEIYIDGWFDLPGHDALCSLAISLISGRSDPLYSVNSGQPA